MNFAGNRSLGRIKALKIAAELIIMFKGKSLHNKKHYHRRMSRENLKFTKDKDQMESAFKLSYMSRPIFSWV